ncbi:MAG: Fic/DOC family protein [Tenericutes bacterium ADurb.BinA155]|nr:MAG: Fic/DOC family protein [Tenericutes bacterium ADurb.BinA155]
MAISYDKLFALLKERSLQKTDLALGAGLAPATLAKLSKNQEVSLKIILKICRYLQVQPGDLLSYVPDPEIAPLLDRLLSEKKSGLKGGIYQQTQIVLTYNSNHIEGSKLSYDQTRLIYETNTLLSEKEAGVAVDDVLETANHFACIRYVLDHALEPLSEGFIKELHRILKTGTHDASLEWFALGDYKKVPNQIGEKPTTAPEAVAKAMKKLLASYHAKASISFSDIVDFHAQFETIHPFQDGNGRVGRLIAFKECLKAGLVPFYIDEDMKVYYYRGLAHYSLNKKQLLETCLTGQDKYKKILDYFRIPYPEEKN